MGDEVQSGSLAYRGEWEHEVPEIQLPKDTTAALMNLNVSVSRQKYFGFLISAKKLKISMEGHRGREREREPISLLTLVKSNKT